jgi:hypothetical protein
MFKVLTKIKTNLIITAASLALFAPMIAATAVSTADTANCDSIQSSISSGVSDASGNSSADTNDCGQGNDVTTGISGLAAKAVNIFSIVVGVVAVIMIIYGGFKYITSGGDSNNVSGAKNTLIYAIVGLIIVALAQLIVHYVLNTAAGISTTSNTGA